MEKAVIQKASGFIVPNIFAMAVIGATRYLMSDGGSAVFVFSEFVIIPMMMGILSVWFWRSLELKGRKVALYACYNCFIAILLSYVFLREGVICLIIVSPLLFCFVYLGIFIGRYLFKKSNGTLNISFFTVLLFVFIGDVHSAHIYENEVSDTILVHAPPAAVWKNVVAFKRITRPNKFWLFNIGLPSPVESTVTGYYKGAGRKCIFSNGYVFDEVISTYQPAENLTFDVTNEPKDPEIMNHIDIIRGQFILKDNGNGTTTLIGNSWYKLYVFPVWYYDMWAQSVTRNVHLRVMAHIKDLSETR
jgi:hypothetical protein